MMKQLGSSSVHVGMIGEHSGAARGEIEGGSRWPAGLVCLSSDKLRQGAHRVAMFSYQTCVLLLT